MSIHEQLRPRFGRGAEIRYEFRSFARQPWYELANPSDDWIDCGRPPAQRDVYFDIGLAGEFGAAAHSSDLALMLRDLDAAITYHSSLRDVAPVVKGADRQARVFLSCIPAGLPRPDILVHPDGEIALEWYEGQRQVFTISIGSNDVLNYAGLFGESKVYGREVFLGKFPELFVRHIGRVYGLLAAIPH